VRWLSRLGLPPVQTLDTAAHTSLHDPLSSSQLGRLDQLACFHDLLSPDAPPQLQASKLAYLAGPYEVQASRLQNCRTCSLECSMGRHC
jgi:hypothetical protein